LTTSPTGPFKDIKSSVMINVLLVIKSHILSNVERKQQSTVLLDSFSAFGPPKLHLFDQNTVIL